MNIYETVCQGLATSVNAAETTAEQLRRRALELHDGVIQALECDPECVWLANGMDSGRYEPVEQPVGLDGFSGEGRLKFGLLVRMQTGSGLLDVVVRCTVTAERGNYSGEAGGAEYIVPSQKEHLAAHIARVIGHKLRTWRPSLGEVVSGEFKQVLL
ncbi:hypothetical protein AB4156_16315 [Cupriavidus sp. 2MCAB6]|uniref:hypothetical protein n=1 Tax=Cupriavidus sp. 2MCAB6 TaxID=3232981 RepID=UPI003F8E4A49